MLMQLTTHGQNTYFIDMQIVDEKDLQANLRDIKASTKSASRGHRDRDVPHDGKVSERPVDYTK